MSEKLSTRTTLVFKNNKRLPTHNNYTCII